MEGLKIALTILFIDKQIVASPGMTQCLESIHRYHWPHFLTLYLWDTI